MTAEEAIDILDRCVIGDCELCVNNERHCGHCKGSDYAFSAIAEAQKALEKQIPKKPTRGKYGHTECACCGWIVESFCGDLEQYPFCPNCGQAIDWSDDK